MYKLFFVFFETFYVLVFATGAPVGWVHWIRPPPAHAITSRWRGHCSSDSSTLANTLCRSTGRSTQHQLYRVPCSRANTTTRQTRSDLRPPATEITMPDMEAQERGLQDWIGTKRCQNPCESLLDPDLVAQSRALAALRCVWVAVRGTAHAAVMPVPPPCRIFSDHAAAVVFVPHAPAVPGPPPCRFLSAHADGVVPAPPAPAGPPRCRILSAHVVAAD